MTEQDNVHHHWSHIMPKLGRDYPHNLAVRLDTETYRRLQVLQAELKTTASAIIRKAIVELSKDKK
jgi:hypothetical protein